MDLFCGIGSFHLGATRAVPHAVCVHACDTAPLARATYKANFGIEPAGDIREVDKLPPHDVLTAGFPCQTFSMIGAQQGFDDATRGDLFSHICRLLKQSRPPAVVLENVRYLVTRNEGRDMQHIMTQLKQIGYVVQYKVLNALHFGLPQARQRVFIVGIMDEHAAARFEWPDHQPAPPLEDLLQEEPLPMRYFASPRVQAMTEARKGPKSSDPRNRIWITDKAGLVSHRPYALTIRSKPSYNHMLVDGKRRLTELEMMRLQGFPDEFRIQAKRYGAVRYLLGNSIPVPISQALMSAVFRALSTRKKERE